MSAGASGGSLFDRIRRSAAAVTRRARQVRIDDAALAGLARSLAERATPDEDLDPMHGAAGDPERLLAFTIALDAINFGSGWFPVLKKRGRLSGYRSIATACRESLEAGDPWSGAWLRAATPASMATLLGQSGGGTEVAELMGLYAKAWQELGEWLAARHGDRFDRLVEAAGGSAERFVGSFAELPLYRDVATYDDLEVPFYKRAQITAADLARVFQGEGWGRFDGLDRLTLFADNLVPHVLRCHGVLVLAPELAARIDREELLVWGSHAEVEIRAVAVEAVERLVARMAALGRPTTAQALDARLWNAGQDPEIKARPRHRTRCTYY
ncbi:MAG: queuosine salvage family protein [Myxococcota bacterium]